MNKLQRDMLYGEIPEKAILPTNSIFTIAPYKFGTLYVFDVEEWGVIKEAFLSQATEYLKRLSNNAEKMTAVFSDKSFPEAHEIEYISGDESTGTMWWSEEFSMELYLCPFTYRYWATAPRSIYVSVYPIN